MANIKIENIADLNLNGDDLFQDSESFITELNDDNEQNSIIGGCPNGGCGGTCIGTIYNG